MHVIIRIYALSFHSHIFGSLSFFGKITTKNFVASSRDVFINFSFKKECAICFCWLGVWVKWRMRRGDMGVRSSVNIDVILTFTLTKKVQFASSKGHVYVTRTKLYFQIYTRSPGFVVCERCTAPLSDTLSSPTPCWHPWKLRSKSLRFQHPGFERESLLFIMTPPPNLRNLKNDLETFPPLIYDFSITVGRVIMQFSSKESNRACPLREAVSSHQGVQGRREKRYKG